jgi:hypothetical protein
LTPLSLNLAVSITKLGGVIDTTELKLRGIVDTAKSNSAVSLILLSQN